MIINFLILCKKCAARYKDWDKCGVCSLHNNGDGTMIFSCSNCEFEEVFRPDQMEKYTPRELVLENEKRKIEAELATKEKEVREKN